MTETPQPTPEDLARVPKPTPEDMGYDLASHYPADWEPADASDLIDVAIRRAVAAESEGRWVREKLKLPAGTPLFDGAGPTLAGRLHVLCSHAHGYETYIAAYRCNDKQGEVARLAARVAELEAAARKAIASLDLATRDGFDRDRAAYFALRDVLAKE